MTSLCVCLTLSVAAGAWPPDPEPTVRGKTVAEWVQQLREGEPLEAALALESFGPKAKAAIPDLVDALGRPGIFVRSSASAALAAIGPEAVPALRAALASDKALVRQWAANTLRKMGDPARVAVPGLARLAIKDKDEDVRGSALDALASLGPDHPAALEAATTALQDPCESVRLAAAVCLAKGGKPAPAAAELIKLLQNERSDYRLEAAEALGEVGPATSAVLPALVRGLRDKDYGLQTRCAKALAKIGPAAREAVPTLDELLFATKKQRFDIRGEVTLTLGYIGAAGLPTLLRLARAGELATHLDHELICALGFAKQPTEAVRAILLDAARSPQPRIRGAAAYALGRVGLPKAEVVAAVEPLLEDADLNVRLDAAFVFGKYLHDPKGVQLLIGHLSNRDPLIRWLAAFDLADIGPDARAAVPALEAALRDDDAEVRKIAAEALKKIRRD
jgi:HEAT repeat protein